MIGPALNEQTFRPNTCFGCGPDNPDGMHIRIYRDGDRVDRLIGTYTPRPTAEGFTGVVHGGLQFTALDCMAGWLMFELRVHGPEVPLTKSSAIRYLRPARIGGTFTLSAEVAREPQTPRDPVLIRAQLCDDAGAVLTEAELEYVLLPADRFMKIVGLDVMPDSYQRHFARHAPGARGA